MKGMKKGYKMPYLEIKVLDKKEVITTSGLINGGAGDGISDEFDDLFG